MIQLIQILMIQIQKILTATITKFNRNHFLELSKSSSCMPLFLSMILVIHSPSPIFHIFPNICCIFFVVLIILQLNYRDCMHAFKHIQVLTSKMRFFKQCLWVDLLFVRGSITMLKDWNPWVWQHKLDKLLMPVRGKVMLSCGLSEGV